MDEACRTLFFVALEMAAPRWICFEIPSSRRRALSSGVIARDQIARVKQAALGFREAEHLTRIGAPMQKSISGTFAAPPCASVKRRLTRPILLLASA